MEEKEQEGEKVEEEDKKKKKKKRVGREEGEPPTKRSSSYHYRLLLLNENPSVSTSVFGFLWLSLDHSRSPFINAVNLDFAELVQFSHPPSLYSLHFFLRRLSDTVFPLSLSLCFFHFSTWLLFTSSHFLPPPKHLDFSPLAFLRS